MQSKREASNSNNYRSTINSHCYRGGCSFFLPSPAALSQSPREEDNEGIRDHYQKRYAFPGRKSIRSRVYGRIPVARPVARGTMIVGWMSWWRQKHHDHSARTHTRTPSRLVTATIRGIPWNPSLHPPESRDNSATTNCRVHQRLLLRSSLNPRPWWCLVSLAFTLVTPTLFLES